MSYEHNVPEATRAASRWDPEHHVYVTPSSATWQYVDPNIATGSETRDSSGAVVTVARWTDGPEPHLPFAKCLTATEADAWTEHETYHDPSEPVAGCRYCRRPAHRPASVANAEQVTLRLAPATIALLRDEAHSSGRTRSEIANEIIERDLNETKGN